MAEIPGSTVKHNDRYISHAWTLADGDTGVAFRSGGLSDKTIQVLGTFGDGGSVDILGSMDGEAWETLNDTDGTPLEISEAGMFVIKENPMFIMPEAQGDGSTELTVIIGASALF